MKKITLIFVCFMCLSLFGCSNKNDINLVNYKKSFNFLLLDVGNKQFTYKEGKTNILGFSADDVIYSVKGISTSDFIIRLTTPQILGSKQYELYQNKSIPNIPTSNFQIKEAFLFNDGETSSNSKNEGHFTIYPKFKLSSDLLTSLRTDLSGAVLTYDKITKDIDWNTTSVYSIIDVGMTFSKYESIYWKTHVILCNNIMYYTVEDSSLYYKTNDKMADFIKQNINMSEYFK